VEEKEEQGFAIDGLEKWREKWRRGHLFIELRTNRGRWMEIIKSGSSGPRFIVRFSRQPVDRLT